MILALGGAGAVAVHPFDHEINAKLVGNATVSRVFAAGEYLGLAWVQAGIGVGHLRDRPLHVAARPWHQTQ